MGVGLPVGMMNAYSQPPPGPYEMSTVPFDPEHPPPPAGFFSQYSVYSSAYQPGIPGALPGVGIPSSKGPLGAMEMDGVRTSPGDVFAQQRNEVEVEREREKKRWKKKKELEPLTVESLLDVSHLLPASLETKEQRDGKNSTETVNRIQDLERPFEPDASNQESEDGYRVGQSEKLVAEELARDVEISGEESQVDFEGTSKKYHFAWEGMDADKLSDMAVSSVHTSDLSSFDDEDDGNQDDDFDDDDEMDRRSSVEDEQLRAIASCSVVIESELKANAEKNKGVEPRKGRTFAFHSSV